MMMTSQITTYNAMRSGFTFAELMIVLGIITVLVAVTVPYATRSNEHARLCREAANIDSALQYCVDLALSGEKPVRFVLNAQRRTYGLESLSLDGVTFEPLQGYLGRARQLNRTFTISDPEGFNCDAESQYLVFDAAQPWPTASFMISNMEEAYIIRIEGLRVWADAAD